MFTGVGGPLGVAIIAGGSGLISAGASVAVQRVTTGEVNWGQVAVAGTIGAVTGGAGAGAAAALGSTARVAAMSPMMRSVVINGADAVIGGAADRGLSGGNIFNPRAIATDLLTVGAAPAVSSGLGPGAARVADDATGLGSRPFAMGISDHLDDFARTHNADTWKNLHDPVNWRPGVLEQLNDPNRRVLFNLDDVEVWPGVTRAASGRGGATDWELLQIRNNDFPNLEFWQGGQQVESPFR
jgi:hypothetical protein